MGKLTSIPARNELVSVFIISFFIFGLLSVLFGKDVNWDLRNYHFYAGYAFFNHRLSYDLAPAQIQTFHNPLLHLPIYWLIQNLQPRSAGFILGGIQGINFFLSYLIAKSTLKIDLILAKKISIALLLAISSTFSPLFVSELGTTFGDNLTSILILISVFFIIRIPLTSSSSLKKKSFIFILAGIFLGIAGGLKLTNLVYAIAAPIALVLVSQGLRKIQFAVQIIVGTIIGFLMSSSFWMFTLYQEYKSPLFPYYNAIFKSPYFGLINFKDERWTPKSIFDGFLYPFAWSVGRHPSLELPFRDSRWAIATCLVIVILICFLLKITSSSKIFPREEYDFQLTNPSARNFIILFTSISFLIWLFQFGYSRYLIPLDLISSIYILCLIDYLLIFLNIQQLSITLEPLVGRFSRQSLLVLLFTVILISSQFPDWGRVPWKGTWFGVKVPNITFPSGSIVLMLTGEPMSYIIPYFPPTVRFVRVQGNLFDNPSLLEGTVFEKRLKLLIHSHESSFFTLSPSSTPTNNFSLDKFKLKIQSDTCTKISTNNEEFQLCRAFRM